MSAPRLLIAIPHDTLLKPEGHLARLSAVLQLLPELEPGYLVPRSTPRADLERLRPGPIFFFREPALLGRRVPYPLGLSPSFRLACRRAVTTFRPQLVCCDFPWGGKALADAAQVPLVYFAHGVEHDFVGTTLLHLGLKNRILGGLLRRYVKSIESETIHRAQCTVTMSEHDSDRFEELYYCGSRRLLALPQPFSLPRTNERPAARARLRQELGFQEDEVIAVFHGSWGHVPNRRAIDALKGTVLPAIRQTHPKVRLLLAGSGIPEERTSEVTALGYVDDLPATLAAADLALMPILDGAGVRMKTFDSVAAGLPIVATAKALEGVAFLDGVHAAISTDTLEAFSARFCRVLEERESWTAMSEAARRFVETHHLPERLQRLLRARLAEFDPMHFSAESSETKSDAPRRSQSHGS